MLGVGKRGIIIYSDYKQQRGRRRRRRRRRKNQLSSWSSVYLEH